MLLELCLLFATVAPASGPDEPADALPPVEENAALAREAWHKGTEAYGAGRLAEAIRHFEQTYRYSGRSGPLFSLGQAHRHRWEKEHDPRQRSLAIIRFQQYLEADPQGKRKVEAERFVAELLPLSNVELEGPGEPAIFTRLSISTAAGAASATIDGKGAVSLPATPDVDPGKHRVVVRAPGFHEWSRTVAVPEGSTVTLEVPLRPLEAQLAVQAPAGSDLYVDGQRVARLPTQETVAVEPGVHQIGVARPGRVLFVRDLELDRGESRSLSADLEMTGQRKVAFAAMGVGGAAVVTSATLLGLALHAQGQAQKIQDQHDDGPISIDRELERQDWVSRRDTLRTASIATGVSGLVLLGTGVILYVTDRPPVASRLHGPEEPRLSGAPTLAPGYAGASLQARF